MIVCDISVQCVLKLDLSFLHDYIVHTVGYPHAKYQRPNPFCIEMSGVLKIGIGEGNRGALGACMLQQTHLNSVFLLHLHKDKTDNINLMKVAHEFILVN